MVTSSHPAVLRRVACYGPDWYAPSSGVSRVVAAGQHQLLSFTVPEQHVAPGCLGRHDVVWGGPDQERSNAARRPPTRSSSGSSPGRPFAAAASVGARAARSRRTVHRRIERTLPTSRGPRTPRPSSPKPTTNNVQHAIKCLSPPPRTVQSPPEVTQADISTDTKSRACTAEKLGTTPYQGRETG